MSPREQTVQIELTDDEALVLFELIHRLEDVQFAGLSFVDPAERIALNNLSASLEKVVDDVFSAEYLDLVAAACARLAA